MVKKKDLDFKKIKVKIGKRKPSNNVTKFNIKTAKIVLPGLNKVKDEKKDEYNTYFSCNEKDLIDNLKYLQSMLIGSINQKKEVMQKCKLDLTQSFWSTVYRYKWVTPWDDIIDNFFGKIGAIGTFIWTIINNAAQHKSISVNEEAIKCLNLYLQLIGDAYYGKSSGKKAIIVIKRYMKSGEKQKKLLALGLADSLAKYSPSSFWYGSRWKSAVCILGILQKLLNNIDNLYEPVINIDQFLSLAATILTGVIDGYRAGLVFVGEHQSQYDDIRNPPFDDLHYRNKEVIEIENMSVTDALDKWDNEDVEIHTNFDLDEFLIEFSNPILEIAVKIMPISDWCEKSLEKLLNIVKILSRCCVRIKKSKLLEVFIIELMDQFPLVCEETVTAPPELMEVDINENIDDMKNLSNKEKKLRKKKIALEKQMSELCRNAKSNSNTKLLNKLKEELNFYTIALIHQCLVSEKIDVTSTVNDWVTRCGQYISSRNLSRNEVIFEWLNLGKQIIQFSYDRHSQSAMLISDLFVAFARDIFLASHSASKVKRLSLAIFVDACLLSNSICSDTFTGPLINKEFWDALLDLIVDECKQSNSVNGPVSPHPTYVSKQTHYDITLIKAAYLLCANNYPGISGFFRDSDVTKKTLLKECFRVLRSNIKRTEYVHAKNWKHFFSSNLLENLPNNFIWDYFTIDNVSRKDAIKERLPPICSSFDEFFCQ